MSDPLDILQNIAHGSFKQVVEENQKLILIETNTIKVKNAVLRQFIEKAKQDGYNDSDLLQVLLNMDEAVEKNNVKQVLKSYLS